ncbi:MAG: hypothetical protein HYV65_00810 [Candidatus Spechtbacteria bacterium]|nr:hypothetical protein [Candidatus Spechtbacteria bacterium]
MEDQKDATKEANSCMACVCPCEAHKEHTHDEHKEDASKTCSNCGQEHKDGKTCDCGC